MHRVPLAMLYLELFWCRVIPNCGVLSVAVFSSLLFASWVQSQDNDSTLDPPSLFNR